MKKECSNVASWVYPKDLKMLEEQGYEIYIISDNGFCCNVIYYKAKNVLNYINIKYKEVIDRLYYENVK